MYIGQKAELVKRISSEEVRAFAAVSSDNNPIHLNGQYAENSKYKKCLVHGFLYGSYISAIIGTKLPGEGSIYLSQTMNFLRPVFHDEVLHPKK